VVAVPFSVATGLLGIATLVFRFCKRNHSYGKKSFGMPG